MSNTLVTGPPKKIVLTKKDAYIRDSIADLNGFGNAPAAIEIKSTDIMNKLMLYETDRTKIKLKKFPFHSSAAVNPSTGEPIIATINLGYQKKYESNPKHTPHDFTYR